ncbi:uncharacterized protein LOC141908787 [Tubulanus polymorphus]|uniref:uncharacterized protein LOC141908787 n=1 Tax=Tubulanus polymorphus TaxID=672921 RepID=UPI003DA481FF
MNLSCEFDKEKLSNSLIEAVIRFCHDNVSFKNYLKVSGKVTLDIDSVTWSTNINEVFSSTSDTITLPDFSLDPIASANVDDADKSDLEPPVCAVEATAKFPDIESIRNMPDLYPRIEQIHCEEKDNMAAVARHRHMSDGIANLLHRNSIFQPFSQFHPTTSESHLVNYSPNKRKRWKSGLPESDNFTHHDFEEKEKSVYEILGLDTFFANQNEPSGDGAAYSGGGRHKTISMSSDKMSLSDIKEFLLTPRLDKQIGANEPPRDKEDDAGPADVESFLVKCGDENRMVASESAGLSEEHCCAGIDEDLTQMLQVLSSDGDECMVERPNGEILPSSVKNELPVAAAAAATSEELIAQPTFIACMNDGENIVTIRESDCCGLQSAVGVVEKSPDSNFQKPCLKKKRKARKSKPKKQRNSNPTVAEILMQESHVNVLWDGPHQKKLCRYCLKEYDEKEGLEEERQQPHVCEEMICTFCGEHFATETEYAKHVSKEHFSCYVCDEIFTDEVTTINHKYIEHQHLICRLCDRLFRSESRLKEHGKTHLNTQGITVSKIQDSHADALIPTTSSISKCNYCEICSKVFLNDTKYQQHMEQHSVTKPFQCEICGKSFRLKRLLRQHILTHNKEKEWICQICNKGFKTRTNMNNHMRIHNIDKPHVCLECKKGFRQVETLISHRKRHNNGKKFVCEICLKVLSNEVTLREHLCMTHSDIEYKCPKCDLYFKQKRAIRRHLQVKHNEGDKKWACYLCQQKFPAKDYLSYHMKTKHTNESNSLQLLSVAAEMVINSKPETN